MTINLNSYFQIASALIVRIQVDDYRATSSSEYSSQVLRFSDWNQSLTIDSEVYQGLGQFIGITNTSSDLKSTSQGLTITISGIPNSSIAEIINSRIKGSPISVRRVVFDPTTKNILSITGNPAGRFFGIINNYTLDEDYDVSSRTSSNTIGLVCSSTSEIFEKKLAGRKTSPASHKVFYPSDPSMDRVPNLVGANFDFGVPK